MKNIPVDNNSRAVQCASLGTGANFQQGDKLPKSLDDGIVRFKNIGDTNAVIRCVDDNQSDGIFLSPGETEYFYIEEDVEVEVVSGTINVMY